MRMNKSTLMNGLISTFRFWGRFIMQKNLAQMGMSPNSTLWGKRNLEKDLKYFIALFYLSMTEEFNSLSKKASTLLFLSSTKPLSNLRSKKKIKHMKRSLVLTKWQNLPQSKILIYSPCSNSTMPNTTSTSLFKNSTSMNSERSPVRKVLNSQSLSKNLKTRKSWYLATKN